MRTLGKITAVALVTVMAVGVVIGVRSIPDARRYLKIRRM